MIRCVREMLRSRRRSDDPDGMHPSIAAGNLVSVRVDDGRFGVMKVLAVDDRGVHVRLYVQRFGRRPAADELGELSIVPPSPEEDVPLSIGHLPLSYRSFAGWQPETITAQSVLDEDLEGYRIWKDAQGGYF
jgi:hypothetical protein